MAWFEPTETARFLKKLEVHSVYSMVKESTFLKGNFCIYKVSWTFSTFLHRRERKPQNVLIFCHVLSQFNLPERIQDPGGVTRIAFKD